MEISFAHGLDRTPFDVRPDAQVVAADAIPFHGIVPRGLRSWLDARGSDGPQVWERNAHRLHDHGSEVTAELRELRRAAGRLGVLSFGQSALAAAGYLKRLAGNRGEMWYIKEGQISSVWVAAIDGAAAVVLNVARDRVAGDELRDSSHRMRLLAAAVPTVAVASVEDIATVGLDSAAGAAAAVVVRNALVERAVEVHRLPNGLGYALVDRFVTDDDVPARIRAVRARVATGRERAAIDDTIARVLAAARPDFPIGLDIDDGDVVWDGTRAHVVAVG